MSRIRFFRSILHDQELHKPAPLIYPLAQVCWKLGNFLETWLGMCPAGGEWLTTLRFSFSNFKTVNTTAITPSDLFFDQLRDLYSVEVQLCESMPHLVSLCTNEELRKLIAQHAHQNCNQIAEITSIFQRYDVSHGNDKSKAMEGLIEGGTSHLEAVHCPATRDLMMIAHCLRIEFYEMAAYEFTTLLSGRLGMMREPSILSELLAEEKEMAAALMQLEPSIFEIANSTE